MSLLTIDQALVSDFISQSFGLPIAHENADYKPVPGTAFVTLRNFINDVRPIGLADTDETSGALQFILHYPVGEGAITAKTTAQTIFNAYPAGRELTYSGIIVYIAGHERPSAIPEDGWYKVAGLIYYEARIPRP